MAQSTRRVAIIGGLRTPFVKANTVFNDLTALDLGRIVVQELVQRYDLDPNELDELVFGQVVPSMTASSIAREIVLLTAIVVRVRLAKKDTVPAAAALRLPLRAVMLNRNTPAVLGEPTK